MNHTKRASDVLIAAESVEVSGISFRYIRHEMDGCGAAEWGEGIETYIICSEGKYNI
jgi:hypothetical protein